VESSKAEYIASRQDAIVKKKSKGRSQIEKVILGLCRRLLLHFDF
jgi:hypothetical protein